MATADRIILQLDEFGAACFNLSQLMQISPDAYRQIAGAVSEDATEFEGDKIPITPENARRIGDAARALRYRAAPLRERSAGSTRPGRISTAPCPARASIIG